MLTVLPDSPAIQIAPECLVVVQLLKRHLFTSESYIISIAPHSK